jgi:hypothetical protein
VAAGNRFDTEMRDPQSRKPLFLMQRCISALRMAFDKVPGPLRAKDAALHFAAYGCMSVLKSAFAGKTLLMTSVATIHASRNRIGCSLESVMQAAF